MGTGASASTFLYDKLSRLGSSTVRLPSWAGGTASNQGYTFDDFGSITAVTGTNARSTPTSASTNRLTGTGVSYDAAGNLTCWGGTFLCNGTSYQYDRLNRLQRMTTAAGAAQEDWAYVYTADDERFWSLKLNGSGSLWDLRDLSSLRVRQFQARLGWNKTKDSIFRDGQLLAAEHPDEGLRHYHLDHLGTPRLTTTPAAQMIAHHTYFPFGEEVAGSTIDGERLKFTGHERDLNNLGGAGDDLDYMHARYCSPLTGRFLSVDPKVRRRAADHPQLWNRYSLARGNPMKHVDPDGREGVHYQNAADQRFYEKAYQRNGNVRRVIDAFGPGSGRDLNVNRGDAGKHPSGFPLGAVTKTKLVQTEPAQADVIEAFNKGGEAAATQLMDSAPYELKEATIILSGSATSEDKLHELGHVDQALNDPEGFLQDGEAADKAANEDEYKKSESEKKADDFAKQAAKKDPKPP